MTILKSQPWFKTDTEAGRCDFSERNCIGRTIQIKLTSAADMWAETPGLNDETETASAEIGPTTFKYSNPDVDMWAETPDLNTKNPSHGVKIDDRARLVDNFNPEMYAETTDLNQISSADRKVKTFKDSMIAEK